MRKLLDRRHCLEDSIVSCIFFFSGLPAFFPFFIVIWTLYFFLDPLLNLFALCIQIMLSNVWRKVSSFARVGLAWVQPSPSFWATAAPDGSVSPSGADTGWVPPLFTSHRSRWAAMSLTALALGVWSLPCSSTWMITLVDFSPNVTERHLILFFFFPFPRPGCLQY